MNRILKPLIHGFFIGIANIIPGVSGGTIAVVFGIYDKIVDAISFLFSKQALLTIKDSLTKKTLSPELAKHAKLLGSLFIGALLGIFSCARLLTYLLATFPNITLSLLFGLILGSFPVIYASQSDMKLTLSRGAIFSIACTLVLLTYFLPHSNTEILGTIQLTPSLSLFLIFSGFIAAGTMIVPGISGSLMLILMGSYTLILHAVATTNLPVLLLVALGAGLGLIVFTKFIHFCLHHAPSHTTYAILGLIVGSFYKISPQIPFSSTGILYIGLIATATGISYQASKS